MQFAFRTPVFPLLIESDNRLLPAFTLSELDKVVTQASFKNKASYTVIDSTGEGWMYSLGVDAIAPTIVKRRWYKKEIIELCNRFISEDSEKFVGRSLSSKTMPRVILEVAEFCAATEAVRQ